MCIRDSPQPENLISCRTPCTPSLSFAKHHHTMRPTHTTARWTHTGGDGRAMPTSYTTTATPRIVCAVVVPDFPKGALLKYGADTRNNQAEKVQNVERPTRNNSCAASGNPMILLFGTPCSRFSSCLLSSLPRRIFHLVRAYTIKRAAHFQGVARATIRGRPRGAVSYTHLTLPTILLV